MSKRHTEPQRAGSARPATTVHKNAPLTPEGRKRLMERCRTRPVAHVAAEMGTTRRRRFIDPGGDANREPRKIIARWPGHMVHIDVKKVGRIPDGGGWRARYSDRVPAPCTRMVRRPRHRPHPSDRDRQRRLLPSRGVHPPIRPNADLAGTMAASNTAQSPPTTSGRSPARSASPIAAEARASISDNDPRSHAGGRRGDELEQRGSLIGLRYRWTSPQMGARVVAAIKQRRAVALAVASRLLG
jgi:hypothetical protein